MTVATRDTERGYRGSVQQIVNTHADIHALNVERRNNTRAQNRLVGADSKIDSINDIRRRALANDVMAAFDILSSYCSEGQTRIPFDNLYAAVRAFMQHVETDERGEDEARKALLLNTDHQLETDETAIPWHLCRVPGCTGEKPHGGDVA